MALFKKQRYILSPKKNMHWKWNKEKNHQYNQNIFIFYTYLNLDKHCPKQTNNQALNHSHQGIPANIEINIVLEN